ncbi:hypothetical protein J4464_00670 [Candidatus Woesearchaeota archaeon]|nr:hypothetical protein [Candidatus Woesearchaeota archaeon]
MTPVHNAASRTPAWNCPDTHTVQAAYDPCEDEIWRTAASVAFQYTPNVANVSTLLSELHRIARVYEHAYSEAPPTHMRISNGHHFGNPAQSSLGLALLFEGQGIPLELRIFAVGPEQQEALRKLQEAFMRYS